MIDSSIKAWVEPVVVRIARFGIPSIYILEFVLWLALMGAFFGTISFLDAVPAHSVGNSVPASWEAAVHNHGPRVDRNTAFRLEQGRGERDADHDLYVYECRAAL